MFETSEAPNVFGVLYGKTGEAEQSHSYSMPKGAEDLGRTLLYIFQIATGSLGDDQI